MKKKSLKFNFFNGLITILAVLISSTSLIAQTPKKNVLFIMVDDLNDMIEPFGGHPQVKTPFLKTLAEKSSVFLNAHCNAPLCNPSRSSILTGKLPINTQLFDNSSTFRAIVGNEDLITIPKYFNNNGYTTIAAGKIFHEGRGDEPMPAPYSDPGSFEEELVVNRAGTPRPPLAERFTKLPFANPNIGINFKKQFDWVPLVTNEDGSAVGLEDMYDWKSADFISDFLQEDHGNTPFFAACGIFRPHTPLYAPKEFFDLYPVNSIQLPDVGANIPGFRDLDDVVFRNNLRFAAIHSEVVAENQWKHYLRAYLACISYVDACIGHLIEGLEKSAYKDNTIVVFMSDHGFHVGEKEYWTKPTLWEEVTRVPFMIYDPSNPVKKEITEIVSLVDIYPTLIDLTELPAKDGLDGVSLKPLMENPNASGFPGVALTSLSKRAHSLRNQNYRYVSRKSPNGSLKEELYDHNIDPNEFFNIAARSDVQAIINQFRNQLETIIDNSATGRNILNVNDSATIYSNIKYKINKKGITVFKNKGKFLKNSSLKIFSIDGKIISKDALVGTSETLKSLEGLTQGIYIAVIEEEGIKINFKFLWSNK